MSKLKDLKRSSKAEKPGDSNLLYTALAVVIVVVTIAGIYVLFSGPPSSGFDLDKLEEGGHFKGNPEAIVRIVEFSDFQCPACGAAYPTVEKIFSEYSTRIKLTYRHFPLSNIHPFAQKAAEASECSAEQGKFWEMYDLLFQNQQDLKIDDLKNYASQLSLNQEQFNSCLDSGKYAPKVASSFSQGVSSFSINSTPTFFINGQKYGNLSYEEFKGVIESKLSG